MTTQHSFSMYRGDTKSINLTVTDDDGVAVDLTGAEVWLTLKSAVTEADPGVLQKKVTSHTTPLEGKTSITIDPADTDSVSPDDYLYDIQLKQAAGTISTLLQGAFKIRADITRTTV